MLWVRIPFRLEFFFSAFNLSNSIHDFNSLRFRTRKKIHCFLPLLIKKQAVRHCRRDLNYELEISIRWYIWWNQRNSYTINPWNNQFQFFLSDIRVTTACGLQLSHKSTSRILLFTLLHQFFFFGEQVVSLVDQ